MKRKILALWMVFLCLIGCASQDFHIVGEKDYPDYRIFEFREYSDTFSHSLELNAGDAVALDYIIRQGRLQIVVKMGDDVVYRDSTTVSGNQEIPIDKSGNYSFTFTTKNASGNVTLTAIRAPEQTDAPQQETTTLKIYTPNEDDSISSTTVEGTATADGIFSALQQAGVIGEDVIARDFKEKETAEQTEYTLNLSQAFSEQATRQIVQCIVNTYLANLGGDVMRITLEGQVLKTDAWEMSSPWPFSETVTPEETEPTEPSKSEPETSEETEPSEPEDTTQGSAPMLALTFDDGPSQHTKEILDLLESYNAKATFFVVGTNADNYDVTMSRALSLGCEIGNHTVNHTDLTDADSETIAEEIGNCADSVQRGTGYTPPFLRPPYGAVNQSVKDQVGLPMILWSIDTRDWESRDADAVIEQVLGKVSDGDIILMHDLYGSTAEACKTIIPKLVEEGYQLVTISELAKAKGIDLEAGECYYSFH